LPSQKPIPWCIVAFLSFEDVTGRGQV
jgi:hypothetical protein